MKHDTVSFGAVKKTEFDGVDFAVMEKFKAPIEKFHTNQDLQNWAEKEIKEIKETDFSPDKKKPKFREKQCSKNGLITLQKQMMHITTPLHF